MTAKLIVEPDGLAEWAPLAGKASQEVIEASLQAASDAVERMLGRVVAAPDEDITHYYDGARSADLWLRSSPIVSVTSITENGTSLSFGEGYSETNQVTLDRRLGRLTRIRAASGASVPLPIDLTPLWAPGTQNITVIFKPGFADGEIPADIKALTKELAILHFRHGPNVGMTSKGAAGVTVSFDNKISAAGQATVSRWQRWQL